MTFEVLYENLIYKNKQEQQLQSAGEPCGGVSIWVSFWQMKKKVIKTCNTTKKNLQHLATDWLWVAEAHENLTATFSVFILENT